jgi:hypothetical protein
MASKESEDPAVNLKSVEVKALTEALAAPFGAGAVQFKPGKVVSNRAMALAYVDARAIQDRLDEVLGVLGWQDEYECLPDGSVVCRLRLRLGDEWITKMDVGAPSEQPDEGDRRKAAFSDALKRAAVKFGIGRYLYRVGTIWADFDPQKKKFVRPPSLPPELLPKAKPAASGKGRKTEEKAPTADQPVVVDRTAAKPGLPANGPELLQRLNAYDAQLARQGLCKGGDLVKYVVQAGVKAGYEPELAAWSGPAISLAVEETKAFESRLRQQSAKKEVA